MWACCLAPWVVAGLERAWSERGRDSGSPCLRAVLCCCRVLDGVDVARLGSCERRASDGRALGHGVPGGGCGLAGEEKRVENRDPSRLTASLALNV